MLVPRVILQVFCWSLVTALPTIFSANSLAEDSAAQAEMIEIEIQGGIESRPSAYSIDVERTPEAAPDTASLLRRAPGANVNRNGPLTGIAQYRGMFGQRVNTLVDGMYINSGGPNGMDPPLSYIPRARLDSLQVIRGIAPVSSGAETIGGTMLARSRRGEFALADQLTPSVDVATGGASVDSSSFVDAFGSLATRRHRLDLFGTRERGSNYEFADGKVKPTRFERNNFGSGYGYRSGKQEFALDLRRNETDPTGTPSLPMDIIDINTTLAQGEYFGTVNDYAVHGQLYWSDVNHKMSNYELRTPPMMNMTRLNNAASDGVGYRFDAGLPIGGGNLKIGVDGHLASHDSVVTDPVNNTAFRVDNFNDVDRNLYGIFSEWQGNLAPAWELQLGMRYNRVDMDAGQVSATMMMANRLQNRFNAADRSKTDNNFDLLAKLVHRVSSHLAVEAEAGRKTRSPSYQERYLWLPIEATNGLADGNVYVGDIDLDPEVAYEIGLGADWRSPRFFIEPRVFYRYVDDYIQGVPATDPLVTALRPDALQFANVDAKFYGADAPWGVMLNRHWSLAGVISYVRGKRDDISDDLYRIAPLNGRATLTYERSNWWAAVEAVAYAKQNKVSTTNRETKSDSYELFNLRAAIEPYRGLVINAGVENIFDKNYADHLSGINRVNGTDVPVGDRVPGHGRSFFASLRLRYN
jgi:iron complex outermembrane receptor protein